MTTIRTPVTENVSTSLVPEQERAAAKSIKSVLARGGYPGRIGGWLRAEALLVAVLAGSFLGRWVLAGWNSYWLDELYSVAFYGTWNATAVDVVRNLAENSVHPPLYQFILYHWMNVFGDSEVATRSLSNLYVTLATLVLYLLLRDVFSRRVALSSAVAFSLMYLPFYYALEARSYAQTMLLVTLSSYLLLRLMRTGMANGCQRRPNAPHPNRVPRIRRHRGDVRRSGTAKCHDDGHGGRFGARWTRLCRTKACARSCSPGHRRPSLQAATSTCWSTTRDEPATMSMTPSTRCLGSTTASWPSGTFPSQ
jgi:hypothetical protein